MNIMKFITKNSSHSTLHIGYKEKYIEETNNTKFIGSEIDNHIIWKNPINQGISKLFSLFNCEYKYHTYDSRLVSFQRYT